MINVDMRISPLGTRSRLGDDMLGKPILRRTIERVLRAKRLDRVHVVSPVDQGPEIARLLDGLDVELERHTAPPPPYAQLVRTSRWWGLDSWRGGIGSLCAFDEDSNIQLTNSLAQQTEADAVAMIPAAAPLINPELIDAMAQHYEANLETARLTIIQAPPGLAPTIVSSGILTDLAPAAQPLGAMLIYNPAQPAPDAAGKEACYRPASEIIQASGRLLCDTWRSVDRAGALLEAGAEDWDSTQIANWLSVRQAEHVDPIPNEIEIELTTDDPFANGTLLRPRGSEVGHRGPIALDNIAAIISEIADYDDVRIVLGGFGDPCLHPDFPEICRMLRASNVASIAVRTTGAKLDSLAEKALLETPIDVVEVMLDAATPETFRRVHGEDAFGEVNDRLEKWIAWRATQQRVIPLIVPSLIKANETYDDIEAFFDTWQGRLGTATITGYSHCAGQRTNRAVSSVAPPQRECCRRSFSRMLVLADGRVTTCDQDFAGKQTIGHVGDAPLSDLWQADPLKLLRTNTIPNTLPLCETCNEWHRP